MSEFSLHDFALAFIAFVSEFLGTVSGFGSSTLFVPAASLIEGFKLVLALTAILHCFGNFFKIVLFRDSFEWKIFVPLAIPFAAFTAAGALLTTQVPIAVLQRILGIILIVLALLFFFVRPWIKMFPKWVSIPLSAVSGFSTGLVGTGGAIRGMALAAMNLEKSTFVVTSSAIDFGGDFLRMIIYLSNGFMDWTQWFYIPLLGLAAYAGARLGKRVLRSVNQSQFEKIVAGFIFISGLLMLFGR